MASTGTPPTGTPSPEEFLLKLQEMSVEKSYELLDIQKEINKTREEEGKLGKELYDIDASRENKLRDNWTQYRKFLDEEIEKTRILQEEVKKGTIPKEMLASRESELKLIKFQKDFHKKAFDGEKKELEEILKRRRELEKFTLQSIKERFGIGFKELENYKAFNDKLQELIPGLSKLKSGVLAGVLTITLFARAMYDSFEKSAAAFRRFMGMQRAAAKELRNMGENIAINFAHIGVTIDIANESIKTLGAEMGGVHGVTKELVKTSALLSAQLGVTEETTAQVLRNLGSISKSTMTSQKSMVYFAGAITEAAGVPLNSVMTDVAKMSGTAFTMISKFPLAIIKTAVEARRLNTTLNDIANASKELLSFTNNIASEMEASVLIGRNINLQKARELAYNKDLIGSTKEILRIARSVDFENLDVFQMEAFAKATGRSVDELMKMVQAEKQIEEARRDPNLAKQVAAYEKMKNANETFAKNISENLEMQLQQRANQEMMVAIQNEWNKLLMQVSQLFLPIIHGSLKILGAFINLFPIVASIWQIFSMFKLVAPFFLGPLGLIITALQLVINIWNSWDPSKPFYGIGDALHKTFVEPFKRAWEWIKSIFVANSPSYMALQIVKGIAAAGAMIFDALTYPFRTAFAWILNKIPGMGDIAKRLQSGATGLLQTEPVEKQATAAYIPVAQFGTEPIKTSVVDTSRKEKEAATAEKEESNRSLSNILTAINNLNENLQSGKIAVYIDGQLLSTTLARQTGFKNGFGMNVA
jgi:hypothetical protein